MIPMKSALLELQRSIYNRLSASLSCPVYDEVPQGATFPYVAIGEDTAVDAGAKNAHGEEATVTLHVWSRAKGMSEAKGIISSIVQAMTSSPLLITGFALGDGVTLKDVSSIVVKLYADDALLQTNTATVELFTDFASGTQFSSPFDIFGTFNYTADGYWVNAREAEYGQTLPATKVVAIVTLKNGKVLTAENTNPTGDRNTILPGTLTAQDFGYMAFSGVRGLYSQALTVGEVTLGDVSSITVKHLCK